MRTPEPNVGFFEKEVAGKPWKIRLKSPGRVNLTLNQIILPNFPVPGGKHPLIILF